MEALRKCCSSNVIEEEGVHRYGGHVTVTWHLSHFDLISRPYWP